jgi:hypothetical protein
MLCPLQRIGGLVFTPNNVGTLFVAQMPLGGQRHLLCDNAAPYEVVCPLRCRIGIGPILTFLRLAIQLNPT